MTADPTPRLAALDGLRGLAALMVTIFHGILQQDPALVPNVLMPSLQSVVTQGDRHALAAKAALVLCDGGLAVITFYVLSGFVLQSSLDRGRDGLLRSAAEFSVKRLTRLLPAMCACLATMLGLSLFINHLSPGSFPAVSVPAAALNAVLIDTSVHGPSTSVQIELLAAPFVFLFFACHRRFGGVAGCVMALLAILAIQVDELVLRLPNLNASLIAFYFGAVMATPAGRALIQQLRPSLPVMLVVTTLAFVIRHLANRESLTGLIATTGCAALLVGLLAHPQGDSTMHRFLRGRFTQFLGRVSYSYYLFNVVALWLIWFTFGGSWLGRAPWWCGILVGLVSALMTLPMAWLSERYAERGGIALGRLVCARLDGRRAP